MSPSESAKNREPSIHELVVDPEQQPVARTSKSRSTVGIVRLFFPRLFPDSHKTQESMVMTISFAHCGKHGTVERKAKLHVFPAAWQLECPAWWTYRATEENLDPSQERAISGSAVPPPGYRLAFVPRDAIIDKIERRNVEHESAQPMRTIFQHFLDKRHSASRIDAPKEVIVEGDVIVSSYGAVSGISGIAQLFFGLTTVEGVPA